MTTHTARPRVATRRNGNQARFKSLDGMLTVHDWVRMPETKPPYELLEGQLVQKDAGRPSLAAIARTPDSFVNLDGVITVDQWLAMPDVKPPYELIRGVLVQKMVTTTAHNWAADEFRMACRLWSRTSGWRFFGEGPGVTISELNGYIPDVVGVPPTVDVPAEATHIPSPHLAVEVLSRGTTTFDRTEKKRNYASIGVALYVIVDTHKRTIEVYRLRGSTYSRPELLRNDDIWEPAELPGLRVELKHLWYPPKP